MWSVPEGLICFIRYIITVQGYWLSNSTSIIVNQNANLLQASLSKGVIEDGDCLILVPRLRDTLYDHSHEH